MNKRVNPFLENLSNELGNTHFTEVLTDFPRYTKFPEVRIRLDFAADVVKKLHTELSTRHAAGPVDVSVLNELLPTLIGAVSVDYLNHNNDGTGWGGKWADDMDTDNCRKIAYGYSA